MLESKHAYKEIANVSPIKKVCLKKEDYTIHTPGIITRSMSLKILSHDSPCLGASSSINGRI
jgi:hypothetical protein